MSLKKIFNITEHKFCTTLASQNWIVSSRRNTYGSQSLPHHLPLLLNYLKHNDINLESSNKDLLSGMFFKHVFLSLQALFNL